MKKIMENRDKKKYRHKGLREPSVNTVMGEIKYKRVMYELQEEGITKTVYLLDETLKISAEGKVSSNLVEKVIETVPITASYRKAERENKEFNPKMKIKTELKLHIMYEGWKKDDPRHSLVNKLFIELINKKEFEKIQPAIDELKYELNGEYQAVKKLDKLKSYLSSDLERYQDIVEVPKATEGIENRNMGTQKNQIFSKLKKRFCSGRKAFGIHGANALR